LASLGHSLLTLCLSNASRAYAGPEQLLFFHAEMSPACQFATIWQKLLDASFGELSSISLGGPPSYRSKAKIRFHSRSHADHDPAVSFLPRRGVFCVKVPHAASRSPTFCFRQHAEGLSSPLSKQRRHASQRGSRLCVARINCQSWPARSCRPMHLRPDRRCPCSRPTATTAKTSRAATARSPPSSFQRRARQCAATPPATPQQPRWRGW
jgi:hypothetical protein